MKAAMNQAPWPAGSPVQIDPDFARLETALRCQQPDRVPLLELFHDLDVKEAFLGRKIRGVGDDIEFHVNAGYDYYTFGFQYQEIVDAYSHIGVASSGPATTLYGVQHARHWVPGTGGIIASRRDFEAFPWPAVGQSKVMAMANIFHQTTGAEAMRQTLALLPPKMKLIAQTDGIFERFTKMMGLETFSYLLHDDPALVAEMFRAAGEMTLGLFEYMASLPGVGALWLADDLAYTAGMLVAPSVLRKHLFPWYRKIAEVARGAGYPLIFHSDGNLWPVMDDLIDIGFNAIQPIEPKAMAIEELKARVGRKLCLVGNLDLGSTLTLGSPEDVRAEARQRIREIGPGGGYCLGSSNTVTNYVPLENFRAMVEATFQYGRYPLAG